MAYLVLIFYSDNPIFVYLYFPIIIVLEGENIISYLIYLVNIFYGDNSDAGNSDAIDNFLSTKAVKI